MLHKWRSIHYQIVLNMGYIVINAISNCTKSWLNGNKSATTEHLFCRHYFELPQWVAPMPLNQSCFKASKWWAVDTSVSCRHLNSVSCPAREFNELPCKWKTRTALAVKLLQQLLQVSRRSNSQARQQVLECLREAVVPQCKEKVVLIWCPAI